MAQTLSAPARTAAHTVNAPDTPALVHGGQLLPSPLLLRAKRPSALYVEDLPWHEPEVHTPRDQPIIVKVPDAPVRKRRLAARTKTIPPPSTELLLCRSCGCLNWKEQ